MNIEEMSQRELWEFIANKVVSLEAKATKQKIGSTAHALIGMHGSQMYGDKPYVYHLFNVAEIYGVLFGHDADSYIVCIGHDVFEDTSANNADVLEAGASTKQVRMMRNMTHNSFNTYDEYVDTFRELHEERRIKIADSTSNLLESLKGNDNRRTVKYMANLVKLWRWENEANA